VTKSYVIAAALLLAVVAWMAVGILSPDAEPSANNAATASSSSRSGSTQGAANLTGTDQALRLDPTAVATKTSVARDVNRHIAAQGQVEPNRVVTVRAETAGRVAQTLASEGQRIKANDILVRLEMNDRKPRLEKAQAAVGESQRAYEAAIELGERGFVAKTRVDETFSELQSAQADLEQVLLDIDNTTIRAPFDGILEARHVELGDYVAINGEIATIVDNDPIVVVVQIAQQEIQQIRNAALAGVMFATGQQAQAKVRFIAPRADAATRTFRVELDVDNPGSEIPSGTSAEVRIPTGSQPAHFVSPALLSLGVNGDIGIKTVDEADVVVFRPVEIVLAEPDGVWVSGLPQSVRLITVGQGFVGEGDTVRVVPTQDNASEDPYEDSGNDTNSAASRISLPVAP